MISKLRSCFADKRNQNWKLPFVLPTVTSKPEYPTLCANKSKNPEQLEKERIKTPKAPGGGTTVGRETWGSCGETSHSKPSEVLIISENVVTTVTHLPLCYWY